MTKFLVLPLIGCMAFCGSASAAPQLLVLSPGNTLAQIHSRSLMMGINGSYRQLTGVLTIDPQARSCHIDVTFIVRSLTAPNALIRSQTMSKGFLDPQDFPQTRYVGDCQGSLLTGNLTLHGQTHPFDMKFNFIGRPDQPVAVHAAGTLNRYAWGLTGMHLALAQNIQITNDISLNGESPGAHAPDK